jgi:hypothetical protein
MVSIAKAFNMRLLHLFITMDSSAILLALEEQRKWRDRRKRLEERLLTTQQEKAALRRELEMLRREVAKLHKIGQVREDAPGVPGTQEGR